MSKVLLIEDDVEYCDLLLEYLAPDGFEIDMVHNGREALSEVSTGDYDIIILDVMLPELNGFEVLRKIREMQIDVPILMLTARGEEVDKIVGLEMGADDYLAKPCNPRELLARIKAILRRVDKGNSKDQSVETPEIMVVDDIEIHTAAHEVYLAQELLPLTVAEYNVLDVLLRNVAQVVSKSVLTKRALLRNMTQYDRSIDVHISKLRTKLGDHPDGKPRIKTIRGVGYRYLPAVVQHGETDET